MQLHPLQIEARAVRARIEAPRVVVMKPKMRPFCPSWAIKPFTPVPKPDLLPRIICRYPATTRIVPSADAHVRAYERHLRRVPPYLSRAYLAAGARLAGLEIEEFIAPNRSSQLAQTRQILMYVIRNRMRKSLPQIGRLVGGRDHTTVLYGIRKITAIADRPDIVAAIAFIEADVLANCGRLS